MKEFDVRRAIGLDETLTTAQKYTLIMLCTRLDWHTWTGQVSARDIAKVSSQGERQVKRHLASLKKAGWLERLVELRSDTPRLHHKADTRLNVELVKSILDGRPQTTPPTEIKPSSVISDTSGENDTSGESDMGDKSGKEVESVTNVINDTSGESDTGGVSDVTLEGCHKRHWGSVISDTGGVSLSPPNNNIDQYNINIDQSSLNTEVDQEPTDKTLERAWDDAWDKHEPEPITEELRDGLWYVSRIDDRLAYRQEVHRQVKHHKRYDVRDALLIGDELFNKMTQELIAPQSAIDWVTLQASGHLPSISTPAAPPKASNVYTVTAEQQQRMKEIDRAWATGTDHTTTKVNGW